MRAKVLLVDDEIGVLKALQRTLRRKEYHVEVFNDASKAILQLAETTFGVVVSDYQMPTMNGVEFLCQVRAIQPTAARIILSGNADRAATLESINRAQVFRFLVKPCSDEELLETIAAAVDFRRQNDVASVAIDDYLTRTDAKHRRRVALDSLEQESPGITHVNWSNDNTIIIDEQ
jgi:two-component system probable response regulator PhcQ